MPVNKKLNGVPGGAELWRVDTTGAVYVVFYVPGTKVPMAWHVPTPDALQGLIGAGNSAKYDKHVSHTEMNRLGALNFGTSNELRALSESANPFESWVKDFETEAKVRPWLRQPEMKALAAMAHLEGREVTDAEIKGTGWWKGLSQAERDAQELKAGDPGTYEQVKRDAWLMTQSAFREAGWSRAGGSLVDYLASEFAAGRISEAEMQDYVRKSTDPYTPGAYWFASAKLPEGAHAVTYGGKHYMRYRGVDYRLYSPVVIARFKGSARPSGPIKGGKTGHIDQFVDKYITPNRGVSAAGGEEEVRRLFLQWLGPVYGGRVSQQAVGSWASRIRSTPGAQDQLVDYLRNQRLAMFPNYDNPNLTYEDIATPWRGVWEKAWGRVAEEDSSLFQDIVKRNDTGYAERELRRAGYLRGVEKVADDVAGAFREGFGSQVRPSMV